MHNSFPILNGGQMGIWHYYVYLIGTFKKFFIIYYETI